MTSAQIAAQIPAEYRREILSMNMISTAIASTGDKTMMYLGTIWKNYINQNEVLDCGACLERILNNFRQMQQPLIDLEKGNNLLDSI